MYVPCVMCYSQDGIATHGTGVFCTGSLLGHGTYFAALHTFRHTVVVLQICSNMTFSLVYHSVKSSAISFVKFSAAYWIKNETFINLSTLLT